MKNHKKILINTGKSPTAAQFSSSYHNSSRTKTISSSFGTKSNILQTFTLLGLIGSPIFQEKIFKTSSYSNDPEWLNHHDASHLPLSNKILQVLFPVHRLQPLNALKTIHKQIGNCNKMKVRRDQILLSCAATCWNMLVCHLKPLWSSLCLRGCRVSCTASLLENVFSTDQSTRGDS